MNSETLDAIRDGVESFKAKHAAEVAELRSTVDTLETRLMRPGAFHSPLEAGGEIKHLKTSDGRDLPLLSAKQKAQSLYRTDDSDGFSVGGFVRDAIVGSRKAASGPALVPTFLGADIIDRVRAKTVVIDAGASTVMVDGPTNMARLTQDPTVYQHTEAADDIVESDIVATPVSLNPKLLAVLIPLTVEVVADSPNLDALLITAISSAMAAKLDTLSLATLLADVSIPKSAAGQDPATWSGTLAAVTAALAANQDIPAVHVGAPADFMARAGLLDSQGAWLGKPPALSAMRELQTTSLTAGTAFMGDFARAFAIAMRAELRIEVVRHAKPTKASHLLVAHMRADGVVLQPGHLFKQLKTVA